MARGQGSEIREWTGGLRDISIVPESEVIIGKGAVGGRWGAGMASWLVNRMRGLAGMQVTWAFFRIDPARPRASSCQLRSAVSPVPIARDHDGIRPKASAIR